MTVVEVVLALRKEKQCDGMSVDSDSSVQIMAVMMFSAISHQSQTETCSKKAPLFVCPHAQNGCSAHFLSCQVEYERTFDERKGKYRAENVVGGVRGDRGPPRGGGGGGGGYGGRGGPGGGGRGGRDDRGRDDRRDDRGRDDRRDRDYDRRDRDRDYDRRDDDRGRGRGE
eukprot:m.124849 g.124849  ORF g.124849 m.124849 type:complete len:170 (-) comp14481_c0_seq16:185-694(-)